MKKTPYFCKAIEFTNALVNVSAVTPNGQNFIKECLNVLEREPFSYTLYNKIVTECLKSNEDIGIKVFGQEHQKLISEHRAINDLALIIEGAEYTESKLLKRFAENKAHLLDKDNKFVVESVLDENALSGFAVHPTINRYIGSVKAEFYNSRNVNKVTQVGLNNPIGIMSKDKDSGAVRTCLYGVCLDYLNGELKETTISNDKARALVDTSNLLSNYFDPIAQEFRFNLVVGHLVVSLNEGEIRLDGEVVTMEDVAAKHREAYTKHLTILDKIKKLKENDAIIGALGFSIKHWGYIDTLKNLYLIKSEKNLKEVLYRAMNGLYFIVTIRRGTIDGLSQVLIRKFTSIVEAINHSDMRTRVALSEAFKEDIAHEGATHKERLENNIKYKGQITKLDTTIAQMNESLENLSKSTNPNSESIEKIKSKIEQLNENREVFVSMIKE